MNTDATDKDPQPTGWRERLDEVAKAPVDFGALVAPVLALKAGATPEEAHAAAAEMAEALKSHPQSVRIFARGMACRHMRDVLDIQAPAKILDALLRESSPRDEKPSQAEELIALAREHCELFHDGDGRAFADVRTEAYRETHPLRARSFARWLRSRYFVETERGVGKQAVDDAMATLEGFALRDGPVHRVFVRFGTSDDGVPYVDLGDARWRAVRLARDGWQVVENPPVHFIRPAGLRALPEPTVRLSRPSVPDLKGWHRFLNFSVEDRPVVLAWVVAALLGRWPYVALVLVGEQGSGKSATARSLRNSIDPVKAPLRSAPREERDLVIAAGNGGIAAFDNVSRLSEDLSDALCRLSTGAGFGTRQLYTDDEEHLFEGRRPILLNGIPNFVARDDLADRSAVLKIPILAAPEPELAFWAAFETARPDLLASVLDLACAALEHMEEARSLLAGQRVPRMADFTEVGVAADLAAGGDGWTFLRRYRHLLAQQAGEVLNDDAVGAAVLVFLSVGQTWAGTATALLDALGADEATRRRLPKSARGLTAALDRLAPALRRVGITVRRAERGDERGLVLERAGAREAGTEQSGPSGQSEPAEDRPAEADGPPVQPGAAVDDERSDGRDNDAPGGSPTIPTIPTVVSPDIGGLARPTDSTPVPCVACGSTDFWTATGGRRICRPCHPPAAGAEATE